MMICKECGAKMVHVMSFQKNSNEHFFKCSNRKCGMETIHCKLRSSELKFGSHR